MLAVIVEGDSLAVQMQAPLEARAPVRWYDALPGRNTHDGVVRLLARKDLRGRPVLVSLGTNDTGWYPGSTPRTASEMQRSARRVLKEGACVVWGLVRIDRSTVDQANVSAVNRGLRQAAAENGRLHLVKALRPDSPDGVHFTEAGARDRAKEFLRVARRECP